MSITNYQKAVNDGQAGGQSWGEFLSNHQDQTLGIQLMINARLPHFMFLFVPLQRTRGLIHWTSSRVRRFLCGFPLRLPGLIHWTSPRIRRIISAFALLC